MFPLVRNAMGTQEDHFPYRALQKTSTGRNNPVIFMVTVFNYCTISEQNREGGKKGGEGRDENWKKEEIKTQAVVIVSAYQRRLSQVFPLA